MDNLLQSFGETYAERGVSIEIRHGGGNTLRYAWDAVWRLGRAVDRRMRRRYCDRIDRIRLIVAVAGPRFFVPYDNCYGVRRSLKQRTVEVRLALPHFRLFGAPNSVVKTRLALLTDEAINAVIERLRRNGDRVAEAQLRRDWEAARSLFLSDVDLGWDTPPCMESPMHVPSQNVFIPDLDLGPAN